MKKLNYRPEIDGLRAIAVLSVIFFHVGIEQLSGGFTGVDIFYVISGFLITRIIVSSLEQGFSFSNFYSRRIKRLLPAALFLVIVTVVFGAFILSPNKYVELSKSAAFSNLFMVNIWFMKNSGYFDISTQISPLVHMWSLSVEEQFYLFYPLLLVSVYRYFGLKGIKVAVLLTTFISFILCLQISNTNPDFAFYMLPTRAWELGIGASLTFISYKKDGQPWLAHLLSILGLLMIVYGFATINHNDIFPGYLALLPTVGTALLIFSSANAPLVKSVLTIKPMLFMGKISYSAYLWHWPVVVYYRIYINERAFNLYEMCALTIASILAGYLSWKYIEERYRYQQTPSRKVFNLASISTAFAIGISCIVYFSQGIPTRIDPSLARISNDKLMWKYPCTENRSIIPGLDERFCVVGTDWDKATYKGIVWGDSHSQHWAQLLHQQAEKAGIALVIAPRKCPAYLNARYVRSHYPKYPDYTEACTHRNQLTLDWLEQNKDVELVILAAAWSGHVRMLYTEEQIANYSNASLAEKSANIGANLSKAALRQLLPQLSDKKVLLLGDIPRPNKMLNECALSEKANLLRSKCDESAYKYLDSTSVVSWHQQSNQALTKISGEFDNTSVIIPTDSLCQNDVCETYVNNELIYKDENHIRRNLSQQTAEILSGRIGLNQFFSEISNK